MDLFDLIAVSSCVLFLSCHIPDLIKHIKEDKLKGVSVYSSIMMLVALILAAITNYHHDNYIFMVNDILCMGLTGIILIYRFKKT